LRFDALVGTFEPFAFSEEEVEVTLFAFQNSSAIL